MKRGIVIYVLMIWMLIVQASALPEELKGTMPGPVKEYVEYIPYSSDWVSVGPSGACVISLVASPEYMSDGTLFAGTAGDGVYKTTDKGDTWNQMNKAYQYYIDIGLYGFYWGELDDLDHIEALAISPDYSSDHTLFAGTYTRGVFRSIDGGEHWLRVNEGLGDLYIHSVAVSPEYAADQTVFTGLNYNFNTPNYLYISNSGGSSWAGSSTRIDRPLPFAFSPHFAKDQTMYLGTYQDGIFESTDGGFTWDNIGLDGIRCQSLARLPGSLTLHFLLAGADHEGIYILNLGSGPGSGSWLSVNTGLEDVLSSNVESLLSSPRYSTDKRVFAALFSGTESHVFQATVTPLAPPFIHEWEQVGSTIEGFQVDTMAVVNQWMGVRLFIGTTGNGVMTKEVL